MTAAGRPGARTSAPSNLAPLYKSSWGGENPRAGANEEQTKGQEAEYPKDVEATNPGSPRLHHSTLPPHTALNRA